MGALQAMALVVGEAGVSAVEAVEDLVEAQDLDRTPRLLHPWPLQSVQIEVTFTAVETL